MPRGVWDRSKTKEQRESEKGTSKPAKAGKTGRGRVAKVHAAPTRQFARKTSAKANPVSTDNLESLKVLQSHLQSLTQARGQISGNNQKVTNRLEESISKIVSKMDAIVDHTFPDSYTTEEVVQDNVKIETVKATRNGPAQQAPIPAPTTAAAPIPFNPPAVQS